MTLRELVALISSDKMCNVYPPIGMPKSDAHIPEEISVLYALCGGIDLFPNSPYQAKIVGPDGFIRANPVIRGDEGIGDISHDWFIVAKAMDDYLTIDCGRGREGRCYDSFYDCHALRGDCPIIALSLSELIERLYNNKGGHWYWLQPGFSGYGDAYDGISSS